MIAAAAFGAGRASKAGPAPQAMEADGLARAEAPAASARGGGDEADTERAGLLEYEALRRREEAEADRATAALAGVPIGVPVEGAVLTSAYTSRRLHPILKRVRPHWGVDLAASEGTAVRVSADGVIAHVVRNRSYGLVIDVAHGERYVTRYAHLSAATVRVGDRVEQGQVIGRVGSSGLSTGPHLHYEVFVDGRRRDPAFFLDTRAITLSVRDAQQARASVISTVDTKP